MKKIFYTINEAAAETGLSRDFFRKGCRAGSVPHIKSGAKYFINLPRFLSEQNKDGANDAE